MEIVHFQSQCLHVPPLLQVHRRELPVFTMFIKVNNALVFFHIFFCSVAVQARGTAAAVQRDTGRPLNLQFSQFPI